MNLDLSGKVALVTGGSRGIGKATVFKLAECGCRVGFTNRNAEDAAKVRREVEEKFGVECADFQGDVADREHCENTVAAVAERFGTVDFLINNAGIAEDQLFVRMKESAWNNVIDTNLNGVFHVTQAALKLMMKKRFGSVVNIGSVIGHAGNPGQVNYSTSKAALVGFTKSVAQEFSGRNVRCNLVSPGFIRTDMTDKLSSDRAQAVLAKIPLGRYGEPEDVSNAVLFLCSPLANYVTGQTLHVNGGMY